MSDFVASSAKLTITGIRVRRMGGNASFQGCSDENCQGRYGIETKPTQRRGVFGKGGFLYPAEIIAERSDWMRRFTGPTAVDESGIRCIEVLLVMVDQIHYHSRSFIDQDDRALDGEL